MRDTSRELAALLVGQLGETPDGDFVLVEDAIEIPVSDEQGSRFNTRSWQQARRVARTRHQDKVIIGWYHTHPGTGLDLSSEEREVHSSFFPESWQMMYLVDPVSRDRNFFRTVEGRLCPVRGFRVYGRDAGGASAPVMPTAAREDPMKERYLERSVEKIMRMVRRPAVRPIDILLVLLLLANLVAPWLRPVPVAKVDPTPLRADQQKIVGQLKAIAGRIDKLEQHLAALQVIDEQLASPTPAPSASATPVASSTPVASATPVASPTPVASATPAAPLGEVKEVKVKAGDTLSIIAERHYHTSASKLVNALAHYNSMRSTQVYLGQTLRIPPKEALKLK